MILIPLPKSASRGDQILNAKNFEKKNFAKVLLQENLSCENLLATINETYKNKDKYLNAMKSATITNATQKIIKLIEKNQKQN